MEKEKASAIFSKGLIKENPVLRLMLGTCPTLAVTTSDATLGIYLPLIVVNCIILGRAEAYAKDHTVLHSALDGLGMGVGFTMALLCMGGIRELFGSGTLFGMPITAGVVPPMTIMLLPPGGFFVFGMLVMAANKLSDRKTKEIDCTACPIAEACTTVCDEKAGDQ